MDCLRNGLVMEPLTLEEIKTHLRLDVAGTVDDNLEDAQIMAMAKAARGAAESYTSLTIANQEKTLRYNAFPSKSLSLKTWPVSDVVSISYTDVNGNTQQYTDFILDNESKPARVYPISDWPNTKDTPNAVQIEVKAGFTDGESPNPFPIPDTLKQAILLLVGHFYANRESVSYTQVYEVPMGATYLMTPHRIEMGM